MLELDQIIVIIRRLLKEYHADSALLFGSYARGEATAASDIDLIIYGGSRFKKRDIFSLAEDIRMITGKDADVFEIGEVELQSPFYESVTKEGIQIA